MWATYSQYTIELAGHGLSPRGHNLPLSKNGNRFAPNSEYAIIAVVGSPVLHSGFIVASDYQANASPPRGTLELCWLDSALIMGGAQIVMQILSERTMVPPEADLVGHSPKPENGNLATSRTV